MERNSSFGPGDIFTRVTNEIIQAIEAEAGEFHMPWHQGAAGFPRNAATKNPYRGVNTVALWSTSRLRGYLQEIAAKKKRAGLSRGRFRINPAVIEECQS